jgi:3'-phosphoadenosine 5'-phosphosulfate sulfotransferase (PAPS reductase)/FAD synthetase
MSLQRAADTAYARQASHRARVDRARVALTGRDGAAVMWSGGKDSTVCVGLAAEVWMHGWVIMSDNGADPIGRRQLLDGWVRKAPHLTIVTRPSHPDDTADRAAAARLAQQIGVPGIVLGLRASESGYRRRIARTIARDGEYVTAEKWGGLRALCPILDWSTSDVWAYLTTHDCPIWRVYDAAGRDGRSPRSVVRGPSTAVEQT